MATIAAILDTSQLKQPPLPFAESQWEVIGVG